MLVKSLKQIDANTSLLVNWNMHVTDQEKLSQIGNEIRNIYTSGLFQDDLGSAIRVRRFKLIYLRATFARFT